MSYEYEVFISYSRFGQAGFWTQEVFRPELERRLQAHLGRSARVFIDESMPPTGAPWPLALQQALRRSRLLVAIWEATYFDPEGSGWCRAELASMRARERQVFQAGQTLVVPIQLSDGDQIPAEERIYQARDFCRFNVLEPIRRASPRYEEFLEAIETLCRDLVEARKVVPPYEDHWPVVEHPDIELAERVVILPRME